MLVLLHFNVIMKYTPHFYWHLRAVVLNPAFDCINVTSTAKRQTDVWLSLSNSAESQYLGVLDLSVNRDRNTAAPFLQETKRRTP